MFLQIWSDNQKISKKGFLLLGNKINSALVELNKKKSESIFPWHIGTTKYMSVIVIHSFNICCIPTIHQAQCWKLVIQSIKLGPVNFSVPHGKRLEGRVQDSSDEEREIGVYSRRSQGRRICRNWWLECESIRLMTLPSEQTGTMQEEEKQVLK